MCSKTRINGRNFCTITLMAVFTWFTCTASFVELSMAAEKKKSTYPSNEELNKLMKEIDKRYKAAQEMMGYYTLSDRDWEILLKCGEVVSRLSERVLVEFVPPDDKKYMQLTKEMKKRSEEIYKSANEKYVGAYEDIQYSFGRLRNSCKNCHNHLGIQIYTSLYPGQSSPEETGPGHVKE